MEQKSMNEPNRENIVRGDGVFLHKYDKELSDILKRIKNKEPLEDLLPRKGKRRGQNQIHPDVIRDISDAWNFVENTITINPDKVVSAFIFGGVARDPDVSHKKSDVDIFLIKKRGAKIQFSLPNERFSVKLYPDYFVEETIVRKDEYPEASFQRTILLQQKIVLFNEPVVKRLEMLAYENFRLEDLVLLVKHRMKKEGVESTASPRMLNIFLALRLNPKYYLDLWNLMINL